MQEEAAYMVLVESSLEIRCSDQCCRCWRIGSTGSHCPIPVGHLQTTSQLISNSSVLSLCVSVSVCVPPPKSPLIHSASLDE